MTTIDGILEGKTGNYLKLEDCGDDAFQIIESIEPKTTEIRTEKVTGKKEGDKAIEYYHILVVCGDIEKDLSLTFTALKALALAMPKNENWNGYQVKFLGTKGAGKNIKYNYQVIGKKDVSQSRLGDIQDSRGKIITELKKADAWEDGVFWDMATKQAGSIGEAMTAIEKLKVEGKIVNLGGKWRAT
jgi:hypothetical protein